MGLGLGEVMCVWPLNIRKKEGKLAGFTLSSPELYSESLSIESQ